MTKQTASQNLRLQLKRTFKASPETLFWAWTDPDALRKWFGPRGCETVSAEVDLRPGGHYRLWMRDIPDGEVFYLFGTYCEIQEPERLVFTWQGGRPEVQVGETLVTVEFHDIGEETEMIFTHELFPNNELRERHNRAWVSCFGRLEEFL